MTGTSTNGERHLYIGFRASIITVFVAAVLFVGLILVYLSFEYFDPDLYLSVI